MDDSSRGILIAILAVVSLNLVVTSIQLGVELHSGSTVSHAEALPARYTPSVLQGLADRLIGPYNNDDGDALYASFDDLAKNQISREQFLQKFEQLRTLMGKVESASYSGFTRQQSQGSLPAYQLNYVVKLSGSTLPSGTLMINVVDRDTGPGIIGFFIYGRTAQ